MIYDNMEFFNVAFLEDKPLLGGKALCRYSKKGRAGLEDLYDRRGYYASLYSNECEIRFITNRQSFFIYLSALNEDGYVNVYCGDLYYDTFLIKDGITTTLRLDKKDNIKNPVEIGKEQRFSKDVWRIVFLKRFIGVYIGCDFGNGSVRPPTKDELPKKTFLTYGSSISFGAKTGIASDLSFPNILGRMLKAQTINKSMPGSNFIESSAVDYMLDSKDNIDFILYEVGPNMVSRYTTEQYKERLAYLITQSLRIHPNKYIFVIDTYEYIYSILESKRHYMNKVKQYNDALREIAKEVNSEYLVIIDNKDIINDTSLLCADMVHPSHYGAIEMAENLYEIVKKYIK